MLLCLLLLPFDPFTAMPRCASFLSYTCLLPSLPIVMVKKVYSCISCILTAVFFCCILHASFYAYGDCKALLNLLLPWKLVAFHASALQQFHLTMWKISSSVHKNFENTLTLLWNCQTHLQPWSIVSLKLNNCTLQLLKEKAVKSHLQDMYEGIFFS